MAASLARLAKTMPMPIFGSAGTAAAFTMAKARTLPRFAGWVVPLSIGGLWFVWPAVDDNWKIEMGLKADPEAAAKAAEAAKEAAKEKKVELPPEAVAKVEDAYKAHEYVETDDDKLLAKAASSGDYGALEEKWDAFAEKSSRPGEDDDDEDEDDDDDGEFLFIFRAWFVYYMYIVLLYV